MRDPEAVGPLVRKHRDRVEVAAALDHVELPDTAQPAELVGDAGRGRDDGIGTASDEACDQ